MSVQLFDARVSEDGQAAASRVLASGQIAHGDHVDLLEQAITTLLPGYHGVSFMNMTVALETALRLSGVERGDEILTLAFNCLSSNVAIHNVGARPVWIDIDPNSGAMDVDDARAQINSRTKAIIVYHLAGYCSDSAALRALCDEYGLILIEDSNAAFGAILPHNIPNGGVGDFSVFSFYANRQINGAEGAILMCREPTSAKRAKRLRRFGIDQSSFRDRRGEIDGSSDIEEIGIAGSLNNLNAAIALASLESFASRMRVVQKNAQQLLQGVAPMTDIRAVKPLVGSTPAFWVFMILAEQQEAVLDRLQSRGIGRTKLHQSNQIYSGFDAKCRELPGTQRLSASMVGLPVGWWIGKKQICQILDALQAT